MKRSAAVVSSVMLLGVWSCSGGRSPPPGEVVAQAPDAGVPVAPGAGTPVAPDAGPVEPPAPPPPLKIGSWTYYGAGQGLSADVQDVSADEGGNVYVAGGDALYVKTRAAERFLRFDSENAGLTKNCNDEAFGHCGTVPNCAVPPPPKPFFQCRILSVAGASAGKAVLGFEGFGDEIQDYTDWAAATGGADVVAFDPDKGVLSRTRHVWIVSPPHTVCTAPGASEERAPPGFVCPQPDGWWTGGRRLFRKVRRIAVNHDTSSLRYGDVWFCGEHATFAALFANDDARKLFDRTAGFPDFAEAKGVWEHLHPSLHDASNDFINAPCTALSIAPDGTPWASNQYRTAFVQYPDADLSDDRFGMGPIFTPTCPAGATTCPPAYAGYDIWPDPADAALQSGEYYWPRPNFDAVDSVSHCADGTLWVGSFMNGLARIDPAGAVHTDTGVTQPILSVACDPLDSSVWIGFQGGGVGRFRNGVLERVDTTGAPEFAGHEVQSIQLDRWVGGGGRILYFAFTQSKDASGNVLGGGVAAYSGP